MKKTRDKPAPDSDAPGMAVPDMGAPADAGEAVGPPADGDIPADPVQAAIDLALAAAAAATDAAHEAEAVLAARDAMLRSGARAARRAGLIAATAAGLALLGIGMGGVLWLRSAADLRDAARVSAESAAVFLSQLQELDRIATALAGVAETAQTLGPDLSRAATDAEDRLGGKLDRLVTELVETGQALPARVAAATGPDIAALRADLMAALAELQLSRPAGGAAGPAPAGFDAALSRLEALATRLEAA
uniref:hypothetical protein n=1 Tax=Frigidibacter oleivorans TaxID=2487129 RepID=UPI000F8DD48A